MAVSVYLVTRTRAEVDDAQIEVVARLGREQRLPRHRTAGEQGSVSAPLGNLVGAVYICHALVCARRTDGGQQAV